MDISRPDEILVATVVLIFSMSLAAEVVRRLAKDKCLRLMHDHHVTYLPSDGPIIWGDMHVRSRGFEIIFDSPFINSRELTKTGFLVYEDEVPNALAICRTIHGLTKESCVIARSRSPEASTPGRSVACAGPWVTSLTSYATPSSTRSGW